MRGPTRLSRFLESFRRATALAVSGTPRPSRKSPAQRAAGAVGGDFAVKDRSRFLEADSSVALRVSLAGVPVETRSLFCFDAKCERIQASPRSGFGMRLESMAGREFASHWRDASGTRAAQTGLGLRGLGAGGLQGGLFGAVAQPHQHGVRDVDRAIHAGDEADEQGEGEGVNALAAHDVQNEHRDERRE
jgi:hypothetical protein